MPTITLPDGLALSRILAVPAIMWLIAGPAQSKDAWGARILAASLAGLAAITDFVDGYLARRWGITTLLGAFLDTTADKLLVGGLLVALVARDGKVWLWPAIIMIAREILIMSLRGLAAIEGTFIRPSLWGKYKATVQYIALPAAILGWRPAGLPVDTLLMWLATVATLLSGWDYLRDMWPILTGEVGRRAS